MSDRSRKNNQILLFVLYSGLTVDNIMNFCEVALKHNCHDVRQVAERIIKNSEYDQEIPQSQTAYNPMAPRGRAA